MKPYIVTVMLCACLFGCAASVSDVIEAKHKGEGMTSFYEVDFEKAWSIARRVLRWEKVEQIEESKEDGAMYTKAGQSYLSGGAMIGVWIEKVDATHVKVTCVTKRKMSVDPFTGLNEATFHQGFQVGLNYVKASQPLPDVKPNY